MVQENTFWLALDFHPLAIYYYLNYYIINHRKVNDVEPDIEKFLVCLAMRAKVGTAGSYFFSHNFFSTVRALFSFFSVD